MAELIIALDTADKEKALTLAQNLSPAVKWMKVGLELFTAHGPGIVEELRKRGFFVFLDLKFKDIPNTVRHAVENAVKSGANMINVHASGGPKMLEAAKQGLEHAACAGEKPLLLAVTVLTSMTNADLGLPPGGCLTDTVLSLANATKKAGLSGVVCSGFEVKEIKARCGEDFICLTPGIRLPGADKHDQRRVMSPAQVVRAGADFVVVGRPVAHAKKPLQIVHTIYEQLSLHEKNYE